MLPTQCQIFAELGAVKITLHVRRITRHCAQVGRDRLNLLPTAFSYWLGNVSKLQGERIKILRCALSRGGFVHKAFYCKAMCHISSNSASTRMWVGLYQWQFMEACDNMKPNGNPPASQQRTLRQQYWNTFYYNVLLSFGLVTIMRWSSAIPTVYACQNSAAMVTMIICSLSQTIGSCKCKYYNQNILWLRISIWYRLIQHEP